MDIARALYRYTGEDGLDFTEGQLIHVKEKSVNGWWRGEFENPYGKSIEGWFPSSYVQIELNNNTTDSIVEVTDQLAQQKILPEQPAQPAAALPLGWREAASPDGKIYYYNELTHETTWSITAVTIQEATTPTEQQTLPISESSPQKPLCSGYGSLESNISQQENDESLSQSSLLPHSALSHSSKSFSPITTSMPSISNSPNKQEASSLNPRPSTSAGERRLSKRGSVSSRQSSNLTSSPHGSIGSMDTIGEGATIARKKKQRQSQKPFFFSYPKSSELAEQRMLDTNKTSYCDHFWEDFGEISGFMVVKNHTEKGKTMMKEMAEFFKERASIEEIYARNLERLSRMTLADNEVGTLGQSWRMLKKGIEEESKAKLKLSQQLTQQLEKELLEYADGTPTQKKETKKMEQQIADDRKTVFKNFSKIDEHRVALQERQSKAELKQGTQVGHKEVSKAKKKATDAADEYKKAVDNYNESQRKWVEDMTLGLIEYEKLEVKRINYVKHQLTAYLGHCTNAEQRQTQSYSDIGISVESVEPEQDIADFINMRGTGEVRPVDIHTS